MVLKFDFKRESSPLFGTIYRPVAEVFLKHAEREKWRPVTMIVDTGADYTLLPRWFAPALGIDLKRDCQVFSTAGIGGSEKVHFYKDLRVKIGDWERKIPVGFLDQDGIPPLLGRQDFLETFAVCLFNHQITVAEAPPRF